MKRSLVVLCLAACIVFSVSAASAQEPGWLGVVIARGELRQQIESTPILDRPYRPLHFYGNTVQRMYYRGSSSPTPGDFVRAAGAVVSRPSQAAAGAGTSSGLPSTAR